MTTNHMPRTAMLTDLYELTMLQGYHNSGLNGRKACFELFFRDNPFRGGYSVCAGLEDVIVFLEGLAFSGKDIDYLAGLGKFTDGFLEYLSNFRFTGDLYAVAEGRLVFPIEPVLRIEAPLGEAQLVEPALLNMLGFQSLIATKSARINIEAGQDKVMEFGLRRAQGVDGALSAARASYIGGCVGTSNVEAGRVFDIPVFGTHAHSWIMAFESELEAFRKYVEIYPDNAVMLVDTYDTLKSGVPNAITVARELQEKGKSLRGIRLDSGDLAYLSIEAKKMFEAAGFGGIEIVGSGDLDEYIIHDLKAQGARLDSYGVGTRMVTADGSPYMSAVYKMAALQDKDGNWVGKRKITESLKKSSFPGLKQVWRLYGNGGGMLADIIELEGLTHDFSKGIEGIHPIYENTSKIYEGVNGSEPMLEKFIENGKRIRELPTLKQIRLRLRSELEKLHPTMKRLMNPHEYKVSLGPGLAEEKKRMRG